MSQSCTRRWDRDDDYPSETRHLRIAWVADIGAESLPQRAAFEMDWPKDTAYGGVLYNQWGLAPFVPGEDKDYPFQNPCWDEFGAPNERDVEPLISRSTRLGVTLSDKFLNFLRTRADNLITNRFGMLNFSVSSKFLPIPEAQGNLLRFAHDGEFVVDYYLYINKHGHHCVLLVAPPAGVGGEDSEDVVSYSTGEERDEKTIGTVRDEEVSDEDLIEHENSILERRAEKGRRVWERAYRCSPTFDDFIRRMYIECTFALRTVLEDHPIARTPVEVAYQTMCRAAVSKARLAVLAMVSGRIFRPKDVSCLCKLPAKLLKLVIRILE